MWWPSSDGHILGTFERFLLRAQLRHLGNSLVGTAQHLDKVSSGLREKKFIKWSSVGAVVPFTLCRSDGDLFARLG